MKLQLEEFKGNFVWDGFYSVEASRETECSEDHVEYIDGSLEEALAFVNDDEEMKETDLSNFPLLILPSHNQVALCG